MEAHYCIDASAIIAAWNESHPIDVFPGLWPQLVAHRTNMVLIKPIFDEIDPISQQDRNMRKREKTDKYPLRMWMIDNQFVAIFVDEFIESRALELEREYQVKSNSKGVSENDLKLIAYAKLYNKTVVTEEGKQPEKPKKKCDYKIPLVCDEQGVKYINFVEMLRRLSIKV